MLPVYNDEDIISEIIEHILSQGIELVIFDDGSTDKTFEICKKFLGSGVKEAISISPDFWDFGRILRILYDLALKQNPDWVIRFDSDEIHESGIPGQNLNEAITEVDNLGYNLIQFNWFHFFMTDNDNVSEKSVKKRLPYYSYVGDYMYRAWKVVPGINPQEAGGHYPVFPDFQKYNICPKKFVMRHYPFRSVEQAEKRIHDRITKIGNTAESKAGTHYRYQFYKEANHSIKVEHTKLTKYLEDNQWSFEKKLKPLPVFVKKPTKEQLFSKEGVLLKKHPSTVELKNELKKLKYVFVLTTFDLIMGGVFIFTLDSTYRYWTIPLFLIILSLLIYWSMTTPKWKIKKYRAYFRDKYSN